MKISLFLLVFTALGCSETRFKFHEATSTSLELTENAKPVLVYNHGVMRGQGAPADRARCCYVHPVYTPDGAVITDDFPKDHYHHRGIFWTWPIVIADGAKHDAWLIQGVRQRFLRWIAQEADDNSARLAVENGWFTDSREIIREAVDIVAHPADGASRVIEFELTFEAISKPVQLRGEPTDDKGYGGFCVRFAPREHTVITTDKGHAEADTNMVPHNWAQLKGLFSGKQGSLRIDVDPSNPGFPNGWCLRRYGFLGVNYPGLTTYTLQPGHPLKMKFKVRVSSKAD